MNSPMQATSCGLWICRGARTEFLLMRHADRWDLPKGHVDPGETELQCALRETWEETGLRSQWLTVAEDFRFVLRYRAAWPSSETGWVDKTLIIFLADLGDAHRDEPLRLTEHQAYRWFPWSPPHRIQEQTIDPLLHYAENYFQPLA